MLSLLGSISLIAAIVIASIAYLWFLHRIWSNEARRKNNDLVGWQITVIGTTYGVIIGFMLYTVWTNYQQADANVEAEANALVNVARAAQGLAAPQSLEIQSLARNYVNSVLTQEWPAMTANRVSPFSVPIVEELWRRATNVETHSTSQQTSLNHVLSELSTMTQHRRVRLSQAGSGLPGILWTVLIIGAIFTIVSACLFGSIDFRLHLIQVSMLSVLIALTLAAISDISRPFQGYAHIPPDGFERARFTLENMNQQGH